MSPPDRPRLRAAAATRAALPHLAGFFPEFALVTSPDPATHLVFDGRRPSGRAGAWLAATEAPLRAPRFGTRRAPVALVVVPVSSPRIGAAAAAFAARGASSEGVGGALPPGIGDWLREARIGGCPDLPDPGAAGLGLPRGEAVLVLDPGHGPRAPRQAMLDAAVRAAAGRPVFCALAPDAPRATDRLPAPPGGHFLPAPLAPWTLLDLAAALHGMGDPTELIAAAVGLPVTSHSPQAGGGLPAPAALGALLAATRCADPFRDRPCGLEAAIRQLADWRVAAAENRRIVAATGIEWFKARTLRQALAHGGTPTRLVARGATAIRHAQSAGGAAAVWAAVMPDDLPERAAAAGVDLVRLEDGFLRSAGLGVALAPALSLVRDAAGIHYDPTTPSDLERLLSALRPDTQMLARAAALRAALLAGAVTKYRPAGPAATIAVPAGRRAILVVGQVEDDASLRRGGQRLTGNAALLAAVRALEPDAFLVFKPHPDVAAGMRRGAIDARGLADQVVDAAPIADLYDQVAALQTISSLAGFEALLRGVAVTTWGRPFYAGWGLTNDRGAPPPGPWLPGAIRRRWAPETGEPLTLEALIAGALILYPRYVDPRLRLPCPVEVVVEQLAAAPRTTRPARVPARLRAVTAAASRFLAGWWAAR